MYVWTGAFELRTKVISAFTLWNVYSMRRRRGLSNQIAPRKKCYYFHPFMSKELLLHLLSFKISTCTYKKERKKSFCMYFLFFFSFIFLFSSLSIVWKKSITDKIVINRPLQIIIIETDSWKPTSTTKKKQGL